MKGDYQLSNSEKQSFLEKINERLSTVKSRAIIDGPLQLQSTIRSYTKPEEKWTENIYDIKISGNLGDFIAYCSFNSDQNIEEQIDNQTRNVLYAFWNEKDKNYNSTLADLIWGKDK